MKATSKTIILSGFGIILVLLACLMLIWLRSVRLSSERLAVIVDETREQQLMFTMRDSAHKRALSLFRMAAMQDPFERDDEYLRFKHYAGEFISARDELLGNHRNREKDQAWFQVRPIVSRGVDVQSQALELILADRIGDAHQLLHDEVIPTQELVMGQLTRMLERARGMVQQELAQAGDDSRNTYILVIILGTGVLVIAVVVAVFVLGRSSQTEQVMLEQSRRLRALYETTSSPGLGLDGQINTMLRRGCEFLGTEIAKVCRIDTVTRTNTFLYTWCAPGFDVKPGTILPLDKTFCSIAMESGEPIAISDVAQSRYRAHPGHDFSQLES